MRRARRAPRSRSSPKTSKLGDFTKLNAGLERVDGETNRSELAAKISGEIEKTQMQARRRRDLNAFQLSASFRDPFAVYGSANSSEHCETSCSLPSAERESLRADGSPAGDSTPFCACAVTRRGPNRNVAAARSKCHICPDEGMAWLRLTTGRR